MEFLTDEQADSYGTFKEVPTRPELERFFFLDDDDRDLIALRRADSHRLGIALQLCTVRYVGLFLLEDPLAVPQEDAFAFPVDNRPRPIETARLIRVVDTHTDLLARTA